MLSNAKTVGPGKVSMVHILEVAGRNSIHNYERAYDVFELKRKIERTST